MSFSRKPSQPRSGLAAYSTGPDQPAIHEWPFDFGNTGGKTDVLNN
jgi:hypothetical protein